MDPVPPEKLEAELARLEEQLAALRREWERTPRLMLTALLAVPVGLGLGPGAAFLTLVGALSLVGVTYYLVGFRIREARGEIETVERLLRRR